mmetsp:Transcript_47688/g.93136  ORF Transcript_47688/g.93136 Transcript_47688/m.93136 type:complete len:200 (+) Transcript_47688:1042-1641(+)
MLTTLLGPDRRLSMYSVRVDTRRPQHAKAPHATVSSLKRSEILEWKPRNGPSTPSRCINKPLWPDSSSVSAVRKLFSRLSDVSSLVPPLPPGLEPLPARKARTLAATPYTGDAPSVRVVVSPLEKRLLLSLRCGVREFGASLRWRGDRSSQSSSSLSVASGPHVGFLLSLDVRRSIGWGLGGTAFPPLLLSELCLRCIS